MHSLRRLLIAASVLAGIGLPALADDCVRPANAPVVPDGAKATVDQFKTAHLAVDAYVHALDAYQACVALKIKQAPKGTSPDELKKLREDNSAATDESKTLSDAYLAQVKIYKTTGQGRSTSANAPH